MPAKVEFAVKALIEKDGRILIMKMTGSQSYELPGGRMEFGETAEQTLVREVLEETGLTVKPVRVLDTWNLVRQDYQFTGIIYLCALREERAVTLSEEHDSFMWAHPDELPSAPLGPVLMERMKSWDWDALLHGKR